MSIKTSEHARFKVISRSKKNNDIAKLLISTDLIKKNRNTFFNQDINVCYNTSKIHSLNSHGEKQRLYETVIILDATNIPTIMPIMNRLYNKFGHNNTVIYGNPQLMKAFEQKDSSWMWTNFTLEEQLSPSTTKRIKEGLENIK